MGATESPASRGSYSDIPKPARRPEESCGQPEPVMRATHAASSHSWGPYRHPQPSLHYAGIAREVLELCSWNIEWPLSDCEMICVWAVTHPQHTQLWSPGAGTVTGICWTSPITHTQTCTKTHTHTHNSLTYTHTQGGAATITAEKLFTWESLSLGPI